MEKKIFISTAIFIAGMMFILLSRYYFFKSTPQERVTPFDYAIPPPRPANKAIPFLEEGKIVEIQYYDTLGEPFYILLKDGRSLSFGGPVGVLLSGIRKCGVSCKDIRIGVYDSETRSFVVADEWGNKE